MIPLADSRFVQIFIVVIFLFLLGFASPCGVTSSIGSSRRRPRKTTPFVYKQHVPNVSEFTIGASGQPDGPISRGDPRFKDLVENHNVDIIFRDEDRDGSDRIMSERCKEKLNQLSALVMNQWPGDSENPPVRVKVKVAWDDRMRHGETSLHYEGRAVDVATSDRDRSKLGMLARLAVEAGFDWVEYESHGHIHCSVKSDSSAAIKTGGCFTGESIVYLENGGTIPMTEMMIGDRVLSMRSDGVLEYSEVISFMDRDDAGYGLFYTILTESGKHITLTAKHLLYTINQNASLDVDQFEAVFADTIWPGQYLLIRERDSVIPTAVLDVKVATKRGIYAPLTKHGTIVVGDVIASCYAYIDDVFIAHASFAPMRVFHDISQYFSMQNWLESDPVAKKRNVSNNVPTGMHWYAQFLYTIGTNILSRDTLYVH